MGHNSEIVMVCMSGIRMVQRNSQSLAGLMGTRSVFCLDICWVQRMVQGLVQEKILKRGKLLVEETESRTVHVRAWH